MPDRHPTVWDLAPHTAAKHAILRSYLEAWLPKLAWKGRILFLDGFAGPGEYRGGEPGSPVIALRAAIEHRHNLSDCEIIFAFIEEDLARFEHLSGVLDHIVVPENIHVQRANGAFAEVVGQSLDSLDESGHGMAPAFFMVDPFGFAGLPMSLLARIAKHPRSELLVSFMYESINRWLGQPQLEDTFDDLFGRRDWRHALNLATPRQRLDFLHDIYVEQLKATGMTYTRSFLMLDSGNRPEYYLVFATKHIEGLKAMKRAMWGVAPSGNFQFSDATRTGQLTLFAPQPDFGQLAAQIKGRYAPMANISIDDLEEFVWVDTAFLDSHIRKPLLIPAERNGELEVLTPRKRRFTYPSGTVFRFLA